jgi:O-methyltransferase
MNVFNRPTRLKSADHSIEFTLRTLDATAEIPGDIVECGVYQGEGAITIASYLAWMGSTKHTWGFDSFGGLPDPVAADGSHPKTTRGWFSDTSQASVQGLVDHYCLSDRMTLVPGFFADSCGTVDIATISVLVLDCDLYTSYIDALNCFYQLVSPGGVIIFDEYGRPEKYPGAKQAVDEFFADRPEIPAEAWWHPVPAAPRWYVRRAL